MAGASNFLSARADSEIGLLIGLDSYEYPYWALIPRVKSRDTVWPRPSVGVHARR